MKWMSRTLKDVVRWIQPTPSNLFSLGAYIGLPLESLMMIMQKNDQSLHEKMREMLLMGYCILGEDFFSQLYLGIRYIDGMGEFTRGMEALKLQNPFLLPATPGFVFPPTGQMTTGEILDRLIVIVAPFLAREPGADIVVSLVFQLKGNLTAHSQTTCLERMIALLNSALHKVSYQQFLEGLRLTFRRLTLTFLLPHIVQRNSCLFPHNVWSELGI